MSRSYLRPVNYFDLFVATCDISLIMIFCFVCFCFFVFVFFLFFFLLFFFFSSRRRHTRYWRDWSSDVCSSDLTTFSVTLISSLKFEMGLKFA